MPTIEDIAVTKGDTFTRALEIKTPTGIAYPLASATVWFTLKHRNDIGGDDTEALVRLYWISGGLSAGISVTDPVSGVITVEMTPEQTDQLLGGKPYKYDVQVSKAAKTFTPIKGKVVVDDDVTRRRTTP